MEQETTTTTETPQAPAATETQTVTETVKVETPVTPEPVKAEPQAPEKYDLKPSDATLLTKEQIADVEAFAKSNKMSNEQAQQFLAKQESAVSAYNKQLTDYHDAQVKSWTSELQADKEIGGDKLQANSELTKRVLEKFASPEFVKELDATGFGNHPGFFRMMQKIGASMSEAGPFITSGTTPERKKTNAEIFYGDSKQ